MSPSTRTGQPARSRRPVLTVVAAALITTGCSASGLTSGPAAPHSPATRSGTARSAAPDPALAHFTVRGSVPVAPSSSQDTRAQASAACESRRLHRYQALGQATAISFTSTGVPTAADLLSHFLAGTGTAVHFGARSPVSRQARASRAFRRLNRDIQAAVLARLRAGATRVRLPGAALPPLRFGLQNSSRELYLSFRGTQGLDIRGTGTVRRHRYTGQLTYVIRDSYGFSADDQLLGVGSAMRYLQADCGSPQVPGGARWFPDSVTVTVPFRHRRSG